MLDACSTSPGRLPRCRSAAAPPHRRGRFVFCAIGHPHPPSSTRTLAAAIASTSFFPLPIARTRYLALGTASTTGAVEQHLTDQPRCLAALRRRRYSPSGASHRRGMTSPGGSRTSCTACGSGTKPSPAGTHANLNAALLAVAPIDPPAASMMTSVPATGPQRPDRHPRQAPPHKQSAVLDPA